MKTSDLNVRISIRREVRENARINRSTDQAIRIGDTKSRDLHQTDNVHSRNASAARSAQAGGRLEGNGGGCERIGAAR